MSTALLRSAHEHHCATPAELAEVRAGGRRRSALPIMSLSIEATPKIKASIKRKLHELRRAICPRG